MEASASQEAKVERRIRSPIMTRRRILRERYMDMRDELFPDSWNIDIDNWSRKRYCPICKSSLTGTYNCFKAHTQDIHDEWADIIQPWIKWKGLRNKNDELTE